MPSYKQLHSAIARHLATLLFFMSTFAHATDVRFAFIGDATSDAWHGVQQGMTENNTQGQFLNLAFSLDHIETGELPAPGTSAIFVAGSADEVRRIARNHPDTPVFNLTSRATDLRAECHRNVFHTIPSRRMLEDALRQWRAKNPDIDVRPVAWTTATGKYAAGQLTLRFERNQGRPMNDESWSGWAAAKLTGDLIARQGEQDPAALIELIASEVYFDGQRGATMTFRETGQLRQPLWLVDAEGGLVGEAPVRGVVDTTDLDTLGLAGCPK